MMYGWGSNGGYDLFGFIFMILVMALIVLGVLAMVRHLGYGGPGESALDVLKKRYAKGEIDKKEFEEKKKDIGA